MEDCTVRLTVSWPVLVWQWPAIEYKMQHKNKTTFDLPVLLLFTLMRVLLSTNFMDFIAAVHHKTTL
jgi:hypothetical protein